MAKAKTKTAKAKIFSLPIPLTVLAIAAIVAVATYLFYSQNASAGYGTMEGKVSIGPLCPVEPCNKTADYSKYKIVVNKRQQDTPSGPAYFAEVARIDIAADGSYSARLPSGKYLAYIEPQVGIYQQAKEFEIFADKTTTLDLNFDTGIR